VLHLGGQNGDTNAIVGYEEKPEIPYIVSMGIYAMEPEALEYIEPGERLDLPDLVLRLLEAGKQVGTHLFDGYWLDIGRHEDYERAMHEYHGIREELRAEPPKPAPLRPVRNL
jgi:NDP-sugar pyrophosphorylase family protein